MHDYAAAMRGFVFALVFLLLAAPTRHDANAEPVEYVLAPEISDGAITALRVQVRFHADASGNANFGWDDGWAGERRLWQWAQDFRVTGAAAVEKIADGHWRISAAPKAEVAVSYRIISAYDHDPTVEDSDQPKPVIRSRWFYAVGNALFGYPNGRKNAPATFDWVGRKGIGFASDLEHLAGKSRVALRSGTIADVLESVVIGGRDLHLFPARDGSAVRVAVVGHYSFPPEKFDALVRRVIRIERNFWNADLHAPFLVTAAPMVDNPTVMNFSGTARGDGFALWIDQRAPIDRMKWLLAHEYFHTWNPAQLGTMPNDSAARPAHYWFSEGFTDYYARALMVRSGLISPEEFVAQWNEMLSAYASSPVRTMPGSKAAAAFWDNEAAQQLPYQRGAMLAAIWNARLLAVSNGRSNLDTILKTQRIMSMSRSELATRLFRSLASVQGLDIDADVDRHLVRGEAIILPTDVFGPCVTVNTERRGIIGNAQATIQRVQLAPTVPSSCSLSLGGL